MRERKGGGEGKIRSGQTRQVFEITWNVAVRSLLAIRMYHLMQKCNSLVGPLCKDSAMTTLSSPQPLCRACPTVTKAGERRDLKKPSSAAVVSAFVSLLQDRCSEVTLVGALDGSNASTDPQFFCLSCFRKIERLVKLKAEMALSRPS